MTKSGAEQERFAALSPAAYLALAAAGLGGFGWALVEDSTSIAMPSLLAVWFGAFSARIAVLRRKLPQHLRGGSWRDEVAKNPGYFPGPASMPLAGFVTFVLGAAAFAAAGHPESAGVIGLMALVAIYFTVRGWRR